LSAKKGEACHVRFLYFIAWIIRSAYPDVGVPSTNLVLFLGGHTNPLFKYGTTIRREPIAFSFGDSSYQYP
jgi:hypothetical protein